MKSVGEEYQVVKSGREYDFGEEYNVGKGDDNFREQN